MKFKLREMDADAQGQRYPIYQSQSSSSSSPFTYFSEQTIRGFPSGNFTGGHGEPEMLRGRFDMRDAIHRELEKQRIREEIVAEMARKRILEDELRHELMIEREMMAMRNAGAFPSPFMPLSLPPSRHNNLLEPEYFSRQPIGLEERIIMSLEEKHARGHGVHPPGIRGSDVLPFHRSAVSPTTERIPTPLQDSSQKEVIVPAETNGEVTGAKRKQTPSVNGESSESYSDTSKKRIKEEWSCAICQVTATSERGLNEHLQGKKHQLKEAALIAQKTGANFGLGVASIKPAVKPVKLAVTTVKMSSGEKKRKTRKESGNQTPSTDKTSSANGSNHTKKEDGMKEEKNKDKFKFWCEMCKVGAFSEKVMDNHKEGKKHFANLVELLQKKIPEIPCYIEEKTGIETPEMVAGEPEVKLVDQEQEGDEV